jgi:hypothetical protein
MSLNDKNWLDFAKDEVSFRKKWIVFVNDKDGSVS